MGSTSKVKVSDEDLHLPYATCYDAPELGTVARVAPNAPRATRMSTRASRRSSAFTHYPSARPKPPAGGPTSEAIFKVPNL